MSVTYSAVHMDPKKNSAWRVAEIRRDANGRPMMVIGHTFANPAEAETFLEGKS